MGYTIPHARETDSMTAKEFYEIIKNYKRTDVPLRIVISKPINSCDIEIQKENVLVLYNEVVIHL